VSFTASFNDICPKCRQPTMRSAFEPHPTNRDLALQNFECAKCGPVKTKSISLKPDAAPAASKTAPRLAAS
jgi:hypothetical protein